MHVLYKVAVDAVHSAFHMNIKQVHRKSFSLVRNRRFLAANLIGSLCVSIAISLFDDLWHFDCRTLRSVAGIGDDSATMIEHISFAIVLHHCPIRPAVAVKITKLRVLRAIVQISEIGEKFRI